MGSRNVALAGQLHHGKTVFMDNLVCQTHETDWEKSEAASGQGNLEKDYRYTDTRKDEQLRGVSIKCTPMSLVLPDLKQKSYLMNLMDCPGNVNFCDEMAAAYRLCDGVAVVIDVCEGVMMVTEMAIKSAVREKLAIVVVLNKIDRLITELKLPPADAYHKLHHTIDEVNSIISFCSNDEANLVSPEKGNVCFSSSLYGWSFTLKQFSKIHSQVLGEDPFELDDVLGEIGVKLNKKEKS